MNINPCRQGKDQKGVKGLPQRTDNKDEEREEACHSKNEHPFVWKPPNEDDGKSQCRANKGRGGQRQKGQGDQSSFHMISVKSPADFAPSAAAGKTWASKPMGCASFALASMPPKA